MAQITHLIERYINSLKDEKILFFLTIGFVLIFYFMTLSLNSTYDDNLSYLDIGKELAETGKYTGNFWNRAPTLPFIITVLYFLGTDIIIITVLIPLIFIVLFLIANHSMFRTLYNWRIALFVDWAIIALPSFWRWSERVLVDTPFGAFAIFSLLFFYVGLEKDRRYLILSSLFFALTFLTKISGLVLIPIFLIYIIYRRKLNILVKKESIISITLGLLLPASVMWLIFTSDTSIFSIDTIYFAAVPQGKDYLIKFFLNPLFIFVPLGVYRAMKEWRKEHAIVLATITMFLLTFSTIATLMRYLIVLYGPIFFLSVYGLLMLNSRRFGKILFSVIFVSGVIVGLVNTIYIIDFVDSKTRFGVRDLAYFVEGSVNLNETIAAGNMAGYLSTYTSRNVIGFTYHVDVENRTILVGDFNRIVTNPSHELYEKYVAFARNEKTKDYYYFEDNWVEENNITYVVWSIYDDFLLNPKEEYYNIRYAGIEIPAKGAYHSIFPPPDYELSSDLFQYLETSGNYKKIKEFHKEDYIIIVLYRFVG